ncbi:MAG: 3D domain-containing protein [Peptoniphilus sp.]|nr:3D domain-containing protein [Peptoniphilus sp.]MDY3118174.1 3D domain-containing protein [Peptoniphilus sp.]
MLKKTIFLSALAVSLILPQSFAEAKTVTVEREGVSLTSYETDAATVGEFLLEKGIVLDKGMVPFPSASEALKEKADVVIKKGYTVTVKDGIHSYTRSATSNKVEDILKELNIQLGEKDTVTPPMDGTVKEGEVLRINRYKERIETQTKEVAFETVRRDNPNLDAGTERVVAQGAKGTMEEVVRIATVNGEETARIVLSSRVVKESKNQIVEVGSKPVENTINGKKYKKKIVMKATAYDPSAGKWTASGTRARVGVVAVDPRVIPLGTKLYIESADGFPTYGFAVAEDTGGAIKGNRIDLFYNTSGEANNFGRRNVVVYILEE